MDDAFTPSRDNDRRSQHSQRRDTRSRNGYRESANNSSRRDVTPGMAESGKPPTKEGRITTAGVKKILTLGMKCHRVMTKNNDNRKSTMMKRRTRRSTQKGGIITTTQGLRDNHTTFPLGDSNNQSHLMQGCYNPRHLQQHPLRPLQQAHQHIQA